jgi:hypothetical protein
VRGAARSGDAAAVTSSARSTAAERDTAVTPVRARKQRPPGCALGR